MDISKEILKQAGVLPKLQLAVRKDSGGVEGTGPHIVTILEDKAVKGKDPISKEERAEVVYYVEENGEKKEYRVPVKDKTGSVHYLIERMAEFENGQKIVMMYKKSGMTGYIDVRPFSSSEGSTQRVESDDIPIIEEGDQLDEQLEI